MQNRSDKSLFGIDINEYSQGVDFKVLATTIDFLYLRSSGSATGRFRVDRKFLEFARNARSMKIPVGAYHFGVPSYDLTTADSQCDDFINILQDAFGEKDYGDLFPVLDVETPTDKSISTQALINWIERFKTRFEKKTRRRLMLYTGVFFVEIYNLLSKKQNNKYEHYYFVFSFFKLILDFLKTFFYYILFPIVLNICPIFYNHLSHQAHFYLLILLISIHLFL